MENMDLDALIVKAKAQLDSVEPVTQEVMLGDTVVGVRVWPLSGQGWRELTARHPAREGVVQDTNLGYNLDAVIVDYPRVYVVEGDDVEPVAGEKWAQIAEVLSAPDLKNVALAVWGLNEFDPQKRMVEAGKASKGGPRKKRSSPAN